MAAEFYCVLIITLLLLSLRDEVEGKEVAVILGGYPDPYKAGSPYSETEFFTERDDSCIHTEQFANISAIFHHNWELIESNSMTLMGVYVESYGIYVCPGDCVHLGSSRHPATTWEALPCRTDIGMSVDCHRETQSTGITTVFHL